MFWLVEDCAVSPMALVIDTELLNGELNVVLFDLSQGIDLPCDLDQWSCDQFCILTFRRGGPKILSQSLG